MSKIQRVGELERKYVEEVLSNNFRSSAGYKMTKRLEDAFAEKFNVNYAVAFCNGTATLHAALEVLGVREGDEVIVPPLTMSSTTLCVLQANATPIFADVDPDTFQISAKSIEERITPKTKAIIPVSLYGLAPDFDAIGTSIIDNFFIANTGNVTAYSYKLVDNRVEGKSYNYPSDHIPVKMYVSIYTE